VSVRGDVADGLDPVPHVALGGRAGQADLDRPAGQRLAGQRAVGVPLTRTGELVFAADQVDGDRERRNLVPHQAMLARKWLLTSPFSIAAGRWAARPAATMWHRGGYVVDPKQGVFAVCRQFRMWFTAVLFWVTPGRN
jgi:hypothetical protein